MHTSAVPLRLLIADDEPHARATLRDILDDDPRIRIVGETWGRQTPRAILETNPDVVLLDVQMPGLDGFAALAELPPERRPHVVFVTAYDTHAIKAFEVRAIDYVLKPFTDARIQAAVSRAREALVRDRAASRAAVDDLLAGAAPLPASRRPDKLVLQDGRRTWLVDPGQISWIEAVGSYARVHAEGLERLIRRPLSGLADDLVSHGFFRIHRSALVNLTRIRELRHRSHGDYAVILEDGTELTLSRTRREEFARVTGLDL